MMDINELATKVDGEVVGGRLVATVNGKKIYLTGIGEDGTPFLNEEGLRISNELSHKEAAQAALAAEVAPKRARRKTESVEPEQLELDV